MHFRWHVFVATLFLAAAVSGTLVQQADAQSVHELQAAPTNRVIDTDGEARELVAEVLKQYGLKLNDDDWEIYITNDGSDTPNAAANFTGKRQIAFNTAFMRRLSERSGDNWTLYAIAAHELAHHLGNHVLRPYFRRQLAEREADYHAGFVLGRMGAPYTRTIDVVRWLPDIAAEYPSRAQRLCEIGRGWRDANRLAPLQSPAETRSAATTTLQSCEGGQPDESVYRLRKNRDIYGHDIAFNGKIGIPGVELSACAAYCAELPECKAFSFDSWHGWCFPKSAVAASNADPPSVIGVKRPVAIPSVDQTLISGFVLVRNRRFRDAPDPAPAAVANFDACKRQCAESTHCVAFSFEKASKVCSMFRATVGHYIDELADSGYKQQRPRPPPPQPF
jgi:hypothetical protein